MSKKQPVAIFGASGYARTVFDAISLGDSYDVSCFVDRDPAADATQYALPLIREDDFLAQAGDVAVVVAIGDNWLRQKIVARILKLRPNVEFVSAIHPRATVSPLATMGPGCVVLAGAVIGADTILKSQVSIWSNAVLEHDSVASDYVTLAPSATTGGAVTIGARSFLGLGCAVRHGIPIGADCVVGANSTVVKAVIDQTIVVGSPARQIAIRAPGDAYL